MKKQYNEHLNKYNSHNILWKNAHITQNGFTLRMFKCLNWKTSEKYWLRRLIFAVLQGLLGQTVWPIFRNGVTVCGMGMGGFDAGGGCSRGQDSCLTDAPL